MFVFNSDLLLINIYNWPQIILIFGMALVGMSAFECFAQGWCLIRNRWYEIPFFLGAAFTLFHPGGVANYFAVDPGNRYYFYILGLFIYLLVVIEQKLRKNVMGKKEIKIQSTI